jgi:hypothetical protein
MEAGLRGLRSSSTRLLIRPGGRRVCGDGEMQHASTFVRERDRDEPHPEGGGGDDEEAFSASSTRLRSTASREGCPNLVSVIIKPDDLAIVPFT